VHAAAITRGELEWPVDRLPAIPSYELSGVVEEVGPGVAGVAAGDEVFALTPFDLDGVAADYTVLPAELLVTRPRALGHAESAAILSARAHRLAGAVRPRPARRRRAHADPRCRGRRRRVRCAARPRARRARDRDRIGGEPGIGRKLGAHQVIDAATRFEDAVEPVDVVFDTAGGARLRRSHTVLRAGGRLVSVAEEPPDRGVYFTVEPNRPAQDAREAGRCRRAAAPVRRGLPAHVGARGVRAQPGAGPAGLGCVSRRVTFRGARRAVRTRAMRTNNDPPPATLV
jgi:hypothetical protein